MYWCGVKRDLYQGIAFRRAASVATTSAEAAKAGYNFNHRDGIAEAKP